MNKRGDISITLLVIGVFAVCTLAILSFVLYNDPDQGKFINLEIVDGLSSSLEDFYFYVNSGLSQQEAAEKVGGQIQGNQLILTAEQKKDSEVLLSVQYLVDLND